MIYYNFNSLDLTRVVFAFTKLNENNLYVCVSDSCVFNLLLDFNDINLIATELQFY